MRRRGLEGQSQHRALLSLGVGDELRERGDNEIESACDVVDRRVVGQQRARRGLWVCRAQQRELGGEVAVCRGPRDAGGARCCVDSRRRTLGDQLPGGGDQGVARALLLSCPAGLQVGSGHARHDTLVSS